MISKKGKYNLMMFQYSESAAMDFFAGLKLLIIRDLGVKDVTDTARANLTNILDRRYNAEKAVLITTNSAPQTLSDLLDPRILDRLREVGVYHNSKPFLVCDWESYRGKTKNTETFF